MFLVISLISLIAALADGRRVGKPMDRSVHPSKTASRILSSPVGDPSPPVTVPAVAPCAAITLFNLNFTEQNPILFPYAAPMASCATFAKIVLTVQCQVTAGRQYDRTFRIFLDGLNLYTGTTQEPQQAVAPAWNVSVDLTRLGTFLQAKPNRVGSVELFNTFSPTYNGLPSCSAVLTFYPGVPTVSIAVDVIPLGYVQNGSLTATLPPPPTTLNNTRAVLEVNLQGQATDEFFWSCVPPDLSSELQTCGNYSNRILHVVVDGVLVGAMPTFPYVNTGGDDPYLWRPTPGPQTLYHLVQSLDVTPWLVAGSKTIQLDMGVSDSFWVITASLLIYSDRSSLATNSFNIPASTIKPSDLSVIVSSTLQNTSGVISGLLEQRTCFKYSVLTVAEYQICITNIQEIVMGATPNGMTVINTTHVVTMITDTDKHLRRMEQFVLTLNQTSFNTTTPNVIQQTTNAVMRYHVTLTDPSFPKVWTSEIHSNVESRDSMDIDVEKGEVVETFGASSSVEYAYRDSTPSSFFRVIKSLNNSVSSDNTTAFQLSWECDPFYGYQPF